jgi:ABC-type dipeptide/oligopeptide/nickel transport system permease subunit
MSKESQMGLRTKHIRLSIWLSILVIAVMSFIGIFAPILSPYDPRQMQIDLSNNPPAWYHNPIRESSPDHLLGTDMLGRDILSRAIHGARAAMFLVLIAIPVTVLLGIVMGVTAGSGNKTVETIFLRVTEIISSIPAFMFSVIIVLIFRGRPLGHVFGGLITLTLAYSLVNWVSLARLVHIAVLKVRTMEFMEASRSLGASQGHQIFKHILPHISHLIVVWIINNIPAVILLEALFGYIGIQILRATDGTSFQDISWGGLIFLGRTQLNWNPYILLVPTISVLIISMSFSILGEYLNERLNPQLESSQIV